MSITIKEHPRISLPTCDLSQDKGHHEHRPSACWVCGYPISMQELPVLTMHPGGSNGSEWGLAHRLCLMEPGK